MSRLRALILAFTATVVGTLALAIPVAGASAGAESVQPLSVDRAPAKVRSYWTSARMKAAQPLEDLLAVQDTVTPHEPKKPKKGERATRVKNVSSRKMRRHGRVFGSITGIGDFSCSGTSVKAPNRSLVWTAAHCMTLAELGVYVDNFAFIPAYRNGNAPFGVWPASSMMVLNPWLDASGLFGLYGSQFDYGAAVVAPNTDGDLLGEVVGARKVGFNTKRDIRYRLYGYPAVGRFSGEYQFTCTSRFDSADSNMPKPFPVGVGCDMTGGSSGGAWIGRKGRLVGVTSYGPFFADYLYASYQGRAAKRLYDRARFVAP